jgi:hypothetical protein
MPRPNKRQKQRAEQLAKMRAALKSPEARVEGADALSDTGKLHSYSVGDKVEVS